MNKLDAHAVRLFLKAADERCAAMKAHSIPLSGSSLQERQDLADVQYEMARNELLCAIERADHACARCGVIIRADEPIPCWHRDCPEPSAN